MQEFKLSESETKPELLLLTAQDVARCFQISKSLAYQLMQQQTIPTIKIGNSARVYPRDLRNFINASLSS